jgi:Uma2 family endonuclease
MSTSTAVRDIPNLLVNKQKTISFETFQKKYNNRADGFKYEWNEGVVEKSPAMTTRELFIIDLLFRLFVKTNAFELGGILTPEIEQWTTSSRYRKPDMAYFTKEQIKEGKVGKEPLSSFMIESISKNDQINMVNDKVLEYFEAGVKVVWLIFPNQEMVYVYTSPTEVKICKNDIICSAETVIEGFSIKAGDIFKEI